MESILSEHDAAENDAPMDFDTLFDTKALRIMRILIPFFPAPYQPLLAVWVRFSQLQYALSLLKGGRFRTGMANMTGAAKSPASNEQMLTRLLSALKPCLSESEYQELARMQNMFSMYQRFQQIMPYLSALNGMSGDLSAADMMNVFSSMQGGGENSSAADMMNLFSAMQGGGENNSAADTSAEMSAASANQDKSTFMTDDVNASSEDVTPSGSQSTGSGIDMSRILDLISLFQSPSDTTDAEQDTSERKEEQNYE
ncbi:MAG: hypothetical protein HDQ98_02025 [Lachnospiraceae bacterium]|nr:hypothetical protein [Lachnospiraceae bacterium]